MHYYYDFVLAPLQMFCQVPIHSYKYTQGCQRAPKSGKKSESVHFAQKHRKKPRFLPKWLKIPNFPFTQISSCTFSNKLIKLSARRLCDVTAAAKS